MTDLTDLIAVEVAERVMALPASPEARAAYDGAWWFVGSHRQTTTEWEGWRIAWAASPAVEDAALAAAQAAMDEARIVRVTVDGVADEWTTPSAATARRYAARQQGREVRVEWRGGAPGSFRAARAAYWRAEDFQAAGLAVWKDAFRDRTPRGVDEGRGSWWG